MVHQLEGLPGGAIGIQLTGTLTRAEYDATIRPQLDAAVAGGQPIRYLIQLGPDFDKLEPGAVWEDMKEGLRLITTHKQWARVAVVTDEEWVTKAVHLFRWTIPGDTRTFALAQRADAETWLGS